jgi:drug/metabolite transporter (DMT)-like permease
MTGSDTRATDRTLAGVLLMVAAVTCFTGLDATAKWTSQTLPPIATVAVRYLSAMVFISALCRPWRNPGLLRTRSLRLQVWRALALVLSTVCSFTSLHYLPLGQATAISFAAPMVVAVLAGPVLGEWPGPHRIGAIIAGFLGVLVVVRPGGSMHPAVFVALGTALSNAGYGLLTRQLAGRDRSQTTLFYSGLIGAVVVLPVLPFVWETPQGVVWIAMTVMGALAALGHYLMILAYERAQASMLAPFSYTQLVGATVIGWGGFGDAPDRWTLVGGAIVGGSGLYLLWREQRARRLQAGTIRLARS